MLKNSLKDTEESIWEFITILLTNIPIMFCISSLGLFANGEPTNMSFCPVYLYNNMHNAETNNIYGETFSSLASNRIWLKNTLSSSFTSLSPTYDVLLGE